VRTVATLAAIAACVGSFVHATSHRALADSRVVIRTFQFAPDTVRVNAGTHVVWTNTDEIEHTITSGTPEAQDGRFNGVVDERGASYSVVLKNAGTYRYFCDRHRFMNGTIIVTR
jgi:plastocyanin